MVIKFHSKIERNLSIYGNLFYRFGLSAQFIWIISGQIKSDGKTADSINLIVKEENQSFPI